MMYLSSLIWRNYQEVTRKKVNLQHVNRRLTQPQKGSAMGSSENITKAIHVLLVHTTG
jgi:hypothetical protein